MKWFVSCLRAAHTSRSALSDARSAKAHQRRRELSWYKRARPCGSRVRAMQLLVRLLEALLRARLRPLRLPSARDGALTLESQRRRTRGRPGRLGATPGRLLGWPWRAQIRPCALGLPLSAAAYKAESLDVSNWLAVRGDEANSKSHPCMTRDLLTIENFHWKSCW